ncbi:MAG: hypothetical protein ABIH23_00940, partial [bacterium]
LEPLWPLRHSSVRLHYMESDLDALRESRLQIYGSNDGGVVWTRIGGSVDTSSNVVTVFGDCSYASLTVAEPFPEPMIKNVQPGFVEQGSTGVLIVQGADFMSDGLLASFSGRGIRANSTTLTGSASLIINVTVDETATIGARDITVTTAGGTAVLSDALEVVEKRNPHPLLSSLAPSSGARLHSEVVTLHGSGFVSGSTVATFGSDISVESDVLDGTVMIARLMIPAETSPGLRDVCVRNPEPGGGVSVLKDAFSVVNPAPLAVAITPEKVARGTSAEIEITGADFILGVTTVSFGDGIEIDSLTVLSNSKIRLIARMPLNAPLGPHDVLVRNTEPGGGESLLLGGLLVTDRPPSITAVFPARAARGGSTSVSLTGRGFVPQMMLLTLGEGISVDSLVVGDSCRITARISIALNAEAGPRDLILANRGPLGEACVVRSGFVVENPAPICFAIQTTCGALLEELVVTFKGGGFLAKETSVDFGTGICVDWIWCDSEGTELKALISIDAEAARGRRTVAIANKGPGGGTIVLQDAFDVVCPVPVVRTVSPARAYRGQTLEIRLGGNGFLRGSTLISLLPGITVDSIAVQSPTLLVATINVMQDAVIGARTILVANPAPGGGSAKLPHVFNIENGTPVLTGLSPSQIPRGESVELAVIGDNFYPGVTTLDIGNDILFDSMWVEGRTIIRAKVRPNIDAALVPRNVRVANPPPGGGEAILNGSLAVINPGPALELLTPARGERGTTIRIAVVGKSFVDGGTRLDFGKGISVESLTVKSSTEIEATIAVGMTADPGPRCVAAINAPPGGGRAELQDGFLVIGRDLLSTAESRAVKPTRFLLDDAYPNPFNSSSAIRFEVPERA